LQRSREKNRIFPGGQVYRGGYIKGFLLLKAFYLIDGHLHEGIRHRTGAVHADQDPVILVPGITDLCGNTTGYKYEKDTDYKKEWSVQPVHDPMVNQ
jgi:hypothetical protein